MSMRVDPIGVYNFYLTLIDTSNVFGTLVSVAFNYAVAGFSECSGLEMHMEVFEYKEGGLNDRVHKFPGRFGHANIVLKHGVIFLYDDLFTWQYNFTIGKGVRKDGIIALLDEQRRPAKVWKFKKGLPVKWTGPSLNATQSAVAIESLEIAHEGLELEIGA